MSASRRLAHFTSLLLLPLLAGCAGPFRGGGSETAEAAFTDRVLRPAAAAEAGMDAARLEGVGLVIETAIADSTIPGAVLLVARGGRVVLHQAWGMRSLVPVAETMTEDTIFDMASCTKPLATAAGVM
jgi:CubicO group peptidase (beta-lactamase class C family)